MNIIRKKGKLRYNGTLAAVVSLQEGGATMKKMNDQKRIRPLPPPGPDKNDPQGMYTGVPVYGNETPVQDADDL